MEAPLELRQMIDSIRRVFAGRDGRIALTLVLALSAALEAAVRAKGFTQSTGPFGEPVISSGVSTGTAIFLNILAVVPLLLAFWLPLVGAGLSAIATAVILRTNGAPLTITALAVFLYLLYHLVVRRGLLYAVPLFVPLLIALASSSDGVSRPSRILLLVLAVVAAVLGESTRSRGAAVAELGETKSAMADSTREQTAMEERARIARELHDIVAHHLSVIAVQSETARLTSPRLSADARGRFEAIAETAREALTETRRLLGVLREDVVGEADLAPQPGLEQLAALVDTARTSGTPVRLILQGKATPLPSSTDLAAYRIVQEALTNARRHAAGAEVDVEVTYSDGSLQLRVRDYGARPATGEPEPGHGLIGMRDRATLAGGTFTCGAAEGGGFEVEATLPLGTNP
jgi:signal transduction histidine kinase